MPREDTPCPACPDDETRFRIEDVGMKVETTSGDRDQYGLTFTVSRPAWEPIMLAHLEASLDDAEHRRLHDLCVTELMAAGTSAGESAQEDVGRMAGTLQKSLLWTMRQPDDWTIRDA